jgi:hypothetical protein
MIRTLADILFAAAIVSQTSPEMARQQDVNAIYSAV